MEKEHPGKLESDNQEYKLFILSRRIHIFFNSIILSDGLVIFVNFEQLSTNPDKYFSNSYDSVGINRYSVVTEKSLLNDYSDTRSYRITDNKIRTNYFGGIPDQEFSLSLVGRMPKIQYSLFANDYIRIKNMLELTSGINKEIHNSAPELLM